MKKTSLDLTIEGVLSDPIIAAVLRADRVDSHEFERLLRSTARRLETGREPANVLPCAAAIGQVRRTTCVAFTAW